jgi:hypothetical protein
MTAKEQGKKFYTPAEANAALPLVRAIVADITMLAGSLRERYERLQRTRQERGNQKNDAYQEEWQHMQEEFERDQERLREYEQELTKLGIHLKDYHQGLIDFPCWRDDREVYLCWKQGEPEVAHWHEVDAGFAGRQKLVADPAHQH